MLPDASSQATCVACKPRVSGRSDNSRVRASSLIVTSSCILLREGSNDGGDTCSVTITLESLSQRWPSLPVVISVVGIEAVALQGYTGSPALSVVPESLQFDPKDGPESKQFTITVRESCQYRLAAFLP